MVIHDDDGPDDFDDLPPPPPNPDDGNGKRGRKPACTQAVIQTTAALLVAGNFLGDAARRQGFDPATFSRWRKLGKSYPDGVYAQFSKTVDASIAEYKTRTVGEITASGDLNLRLELLGRQYPRQFGRYRGEFGDLKRQIAANEKTIAELMGLIGELRAQMAANDARIPEEAAD